MIPSQTITINDKNFRQLLLFSKDIWIIQIYDDTSKMSKAYSPIWEDVAKTHGGIVKFGRINAGVETKVQ